MWSAAALCRFRRMPEAWGGLRRTMFEETRAGVGPPEAGALTPAEGCGVESGGGPPHSITYRPLRVIR